MSEQCNRTISAPVKRKDHDEKIRAQIKYVGDYDTDSKGNPLLTARYIRSTKPHANLLEIKVPPLPEGYFFFSAKDVPFNVSFYPCNDLPVTYTDEQRKALEFSMPVFPEKEILYYGEPLGMIVGPNEGLVRSLVAQTVVEYEDLPATVDFHQSKDILFEAERTIGNPKEAFMDTDDFYIYHVSTGRQYQAYLETQGLIAENTEDGGIFLHGSMQCCYPVKKSVAYALNIPQEKVRIKQDAVGGAFGGKEEFPCFLSTHVAVAAYLTGSSVRLIYDRNEDFQFASKRHPSYSSVRFGVKDKKIVAVDIFCRLDAGAYITSSVDVAVTYFLKTPNVYTFDNLRVHIILVRSNTPPCGAFRGFGNPQANFAIDLSMCHLAADLGIDDIEFRKQYWAKTGGQTSTGGTYHYDVPLEKMFEKACEATDFVRLRREYSKPQTGRYRRGIGIGFSNQGATLPGSVEWDLVKPTVRITKDENNKVTLYTGQVEMGQGSKTAFAKIAATVLGIPYESVEVIYPDTQFCVDSGPTAASRSVMVVGKTVEIAAQKLKDIWEDNKAQEVTGTFDKPDSRWAGYDSVNYVGDSYVDYLWALTVLEVEMDTFTGNVDILNAHAVYSVGTPIDINILRGQMEGGLLQGIGYAHSERMVIGDSGRMFNTAFADYHMPTFLDVPNMSVDFVYDEYDDGPFGAKGAGEIPIPSVPCAYINALEQAMGGPKEHMLKKIPFVPEDVIKEFCENGACM